MSRVDLLARRSGALLRDDVDRTVDVERSLTALRTRRRRQRQLRAVAAGLAAAAAVAVVWGAAAVRDRDAVEPAPAPTPNPTASGTPTAGGPFVCVPAPSLRCLPGDRVHVGGPEPYTIRPDSRFGSDIGLGPGGTELYRDDTGSGAGIVLVDDAVPARTGRQLPAEQLARWVAARPYLEAVGPHRTTVAGLPAWRVEVTTERDPGGADRTCNRTIPTCWPLLGTVRAGTGPWESGPRPGMASRYTFVDLPGGATFAVWSWAYGGDWEAVRTSDELVRTLRFDRR
jgi:hypothetical protein